ALCPSPSAVRACACCCSPPPPSPTCCWRARPRASASSRSARRSAPAANGWGGSGLPRAAALCSAAGPPRLVRFFPSLVPTSLPIGTQPGVDLRVVAFAAAFTALTAMGFGLFPAIRAGRRTGFDALPEGARAGGGAKQRLRAVLVTVEVTMSVILLITSGLLIRAVW